MLVQLLLLLLPMRLLVVLELVDVLDLGTSKCNVVLSFFVCVCVVSC
jgi:hypothetical protein